MSANRHALDQSRPGWLMRHSGTLAKLIPLIPGFTISIIIGVVASQPLLLGHLPVAPDALYHVQRLIELDSLIRQGIIYSRWSPDLVFGYGYPLFNYVCPLVYYLAEA